MKEENETRKVIVAFSPVIRAHDTTGEAENAPFVWFDPEAVVHVRTNDPKASNSELYREAEVALKEITRYILKNEDWRREFISQYVIAASEAIPN